MPPGENFSSIGAKMVKIALLAPDRAPRDSEWGSVGHENVTYDDDFISSSFEVKMSLWLKFQLNQSRNGKKSHLSPR